MQPLSLISMGLVGFVMERVRRVYAPAVRDMKRLESLSMKWFFVSLFINKKKGNYLFINSSITYLFSSISINTRCTNDSILWSTTNMYKRFFSMS